MIEISGYTNIDYCADYTHWTCSPPVPQSEIVNVPFRNGQVDLYEFMQMPLTFGARTITIELELRSMRSEWPYYYSKMLERYHGRPVNLSRTEDPNWRWRGVGAVGPLQDKGATAAVVITVTADPYKYKIARQIAAVPLVNGQYVSYTFDKPKGYIYINNEVPGGMIEWGVSVRINGGRTYYAENGGLDGIYVEQDDVLEFFTTYDDVTARIIYEEVSL